LEDIFKEKNEDKMELYLVTKLLGTSLDDFIDKRLESPHLKNLVFFVLFNSKGISEFHATIVNGSSIFNFKFLHL
jgi:hypothetical protein